MTKYVINDQHQGYLIIDVAGYLVTHDKTKLLGGIPATTNLVAFENNIYLVTPRGRVEGYKLSKDAAKGIRVKKHIELQCDIPRNQRVTSVVASAKHLVLISNTYKHFSVSLRRPKEKPLSS